MPAPTARRRSAENSDKNSKQGDFFATANIEENSTDVDVPISITSSVPFEPKKTEENLDMLIDEEGRPIFSATKNTTEGVKKEKRAISVPPHRFTPLKEQWSKIYYPLVDHLKLQVKMDPHRKRVLIRTCQETTDRSAIQKGYDFLHAFMLGFDVDDSTALLRLDDLYLESFEIKDIKTFHGEHLSRAIGRIAGKDGKTKYAIENATRTRIVLADSKIHILGGFLNIKIARRSISNLIMGTPAGKIYGRLRIVSSRMKERF